MGEPRLTCSQRGRARCHPNKTQMVAPSLLPVDLIPRDIWRHRSRAGTARKPSIAAGMWRQAESPHARSRVPQRTLTEQNRDASNSPFTTAPLTSPSPQTPLRFLLTGWGDAPLPVLCLDHARHRSVFSCLAVLPSALHGASVLSRHYLTHHSLPSLQGGDRNCPHFIELEAEMPRI